MLWLLNLSAALCFRAAHLEAMVPKDMLYLKIQKKIEDPSVGKVAPAWLIRSERHLKTAVSLHHPPFVQPLFVGSSGKLGTTLMNWVQSLISQVCSISNHQSSFPFIWLLAWMSRFLCLDSMFFFCFSIYVEAFCLWVFIYVPQLGKTIFMCTLCFFTPMLLHINGLLVVCLNKHNFPFSACGWLANFQAF